MAQKRSGSSSSRAQDVDAGEGRHPGRSALGSQGRREQGRQGTRAPAEGAPRRRQDGETAARAHAAPASRPRRVAELRDALRKNLIGPMDMVMLSRERIEEVLGEAVDQGRVTARDAQRITPAWSSAGSKQTNDVLKDLENLLGRGRSEIEGRASGAARPRGPARLTRARPRPTASGAPPASGRASRSPATTT